MHSQKKDKWKAEDYEEFLGNVNKCNLKEVSEIYNKTEDWVRQRIKRLEMSGFKTDEGFKIVNIMKETETEIRVQIVVKGKEKKNFNISKKAGYIVAVY
jgi:DNA-binding Lrp family transcriptional regulator